MTKFFEIAAIYASGHVSHKFIEAQTEAQALEIVLHSSRKVVASMTASDFSNELFAQRTAIVESFGIVKI